MMTPFIGTIKSITTDNGSELAGHKYMARWLKTRVYFPLFSVMSTIMYIFTTKNRDGFYALFWGAAIFDYQSKYYKNKFRMPFLSFVDIMNLGKIFLLMLCCSLPKSLFPQQPLPKNVKTLLHTLPELSHARNHRELLYQYSVGDFSHVSDEDTREAIKELAKRGVGVITFWEKGDKMEQRIQEGIRIAHIQESLGLSVVVDVSRLLYGFFDGTPATSHIDGKGGVFTDNSFVGQTMGCPFTVEKQIPVIKARIVAYAEAYKRAGINIKMVTADWEIDGPLEWNDAWSHSKRCVRCCENVPNIQDFLSFQAVLRSKRSKLMHECYSGPILERFPDALVTNYATYPNDGWRYWYDYFESPQPELPHMKDQKALYRPWYDEFTETGFTLAMPVVYTWYPTYMWYPDYSDDYRWFYNMLKVGSNAGKSTPSGIPIATFVHWHTTAPPNNPDPEVKQMGKEAYKELLWHLLLRGNDMFFSWCTSEELEIEMELLQSVYNSSLEYNQWFESGRPITFDVPVDEKHVISGLLLNQKILVRRTDFIEHPGPITIFVNGAALSVPHRPGECQIITLRE
ncbi:MAG: hypothetical protein ACOX19_02210 [Fermentimonas sp.]|jgi:hypothetical protein